MQRMSSDVAIPYTLQSRHLVKEMPDFCIGYECNEF